jgi:hypothetical protein
VSDDRWRSKFVGGRRLEQAVDPLGKWSPIGGVLPEVASILVDCRRYYRETKISQTPGLRDVRWTADVVLQADNKSEGAMGEDFAVHMFPVPETGFDIDGAVAMLPAIPTEDWIRIVDEWGGDAYAETALTPAGCPARATEAMRMLDSDRRDCATLGVKSPISGEKFNVWVAGGMSVGDPPSEAYDLAGLILCLPSDLQQGLFREVSTFG